MLVEPGMGERIRTAARSKKATARVAFFV